MLTLALMLAAAGLSTCKAENAVYRQRTAPLITARFLAIDSGHDWPSNLALRMDFAGSGRTYWWLPWNGGTNAQQNLASTSDVTARGWRPDGPDGRRPLGDVSYIGMDASYRVLQEVPKRGGLAPAHFFIPDLREAVWYRSGPDNRDGDARQFFDLVRCAKR